MSIATRILEARLAKGLTQEALARKIGVTKGAIGNYENGVSVPKIEIMFKLFEVLGCDANFFYQDECPAIMPPASSALSTEEAALISAYHAADPAIQAAVRKLLDIPDAQKKAMSQSAI